MTKKLTYDDGHNFVEYDPSTRLLSISRGSFRNRRLAIQIFDVPEDKISYKVLVEFATSDLGVVYSGGGDMKLRRIFFQPEPED